LSHVVINALITVSFNNNNTQRMGKPPKVFNVGTFLVEKTSVAFRPIHANSLGLWIPEFQLRYS
jgi:hypothetical protein